MGVIGQKVELDCLFSEMNTIYINRLRLIKSTVVEATRPTTSTYYGRQRANLYIQRS